MKSTSGKTILHSTPPTRGFACNWCCENRLGLDCVVTRGGPARSRSVQSPMARTGGAIASPKGRAHGAVTTGVWAVQRGGGSAAAHISRWREKQDVFRKYWTENTYYQYAVKSYNHFGFYLCAFKPDKLFLCLLLSQCKLLQVSYNWKYEALKTLKFYSCSVLILQDLLFLT